MRRWEMIEKQTTKGKKKMNTNKVKKVIDTIRGNDIYIYVDTRKKSQACHALTKIGCNESMVNQYYIAVKNGEPLKDIKGNIMYFRTATTAKAVAA